jgi:hypothetical protein
MNKLFILLLAAIMPAGLPFGEARPSPAETALRFINSLSTKQKQKAVRPFEEMSRSEWSYLPVVSVPRQGIPLKELDAKQKGLLNDLLQAYLSREGYAKARAVLVLEQVLYELSGHSDLRDPGLYVVAIYGTPGKDPVWGWKFEGHHISLNFTVVKDRTAFAPFFFGANPAEVKEGPQKGLRVLRAEEDLALELVQALSPEQRAKAIFQSSAFADIVTASASQVNPLEPVGIAARELTAAQQALLNRLLTTYLSAMPAALSEARMQRLAHEDGTTIRFGWAGATERGKPHYYRVQGATFLIEFDNTQNNANHIHTVWRDFNGDFGRDLLREHYRAAHGVSGE